jgi:hypothetical protein
MGIFIWLYVFMNDGDPTFSEAQFANEQNPCCKHIVFGPLLQNPLSTWHFLFGVRLSSTLYMNTKFGITWTSTPRTSCFQNVTVSNGYNVSSKGLSIFSYYLFHLFEMSRNRSVNMACNDMHYITEPISHPTYFRQNMEWPLALTLKQHFTINSNTGNEQNVEASRAECSWQHQSI